MRVAVTGGRGFIGSHVIKELEERGHSYSVIDSLAGYDILGPFLAEGLMHCDAVIHLAGVLGTEELFDNPELAIDVNLKGTARVLKVCERDGLRYVGITMPKVWDNLYQTTKQAAMGFAASYNRHFGVPVSHVRAFNAFGPGQKVYGVQKIIPTFATRAWANQPLPIWGDGTQTVDLVHVEDVAQMLVDALAFWHNEVFDAGTGRAVSVNEIAQFVLDVTGSTAGVEHLPMRKGEHEAKVVADGIGWDLLGWKPEFDMNKLADTIRWYKDI